MRSKRRRSASRSVSATASGWSWNRAAACSLESRADAELPRRSPSVSSSVAPSRTATSASWRGRRDRSWACASPVATVGTPRRSASEASQRLRERSWRQSGRCSSIRNPSRPKARSNRRASVSAPAGSPRSHVPATAPSRAQPERQTSPSVWRSSSSIGIEGGSASRRCEGARERNPFDADSRVPRWAAVISRQRLAQPLASSTRRVTCTGRGIRRCTSTVSSQPTIGRTPTPPQAWANSIAPQTLSWSVSARASWPRPAAVAASSAGSEAPSRKE